MGCTIFFKNNGLLTQRNSGFKEKDSTINQLIHLCDHIYKRLDESKDVKMYALFSLTFPRLLIRSITPPYFINWNLMELKGIFYIG